MSLPALQLQPISTSHYYISGDVTIQEGVAIAPGVLIQADPESCIVIKKGACIGIGSILHAHQGTLEIGEGANIGAEVLLIGQVTIGAHACIGSATTIVNTSVEWGQVIPPGTLLGDSSRPQPELQATDTVVSPEETPTEATETTETPTVVMEPEAALPSNEGQNAGVNVYGQMYVNQLMVKLFPGSQRQNKPDSSAIVEDPWDD